MNYFKTVGGVLILLATIGLESLFAAGIWYMIAVGMYPALGSPFAYILAFIVAPIIGIMAIVMFVYGHRLKQIVLEWEAQNGKLWDEEHQVYHNKHSYTWFVDAMKWIVLFADTCAICYRILQEPVPWYGQALLAIVFEVLAISPWFVGTLVHIVATRPAYAIKRDVAYIREISEAQDELKDLQAERKAAHKERKAPATARVTTQHQAVLPSPKTSALPEYQASKESVSMNQNGIIESRKK